MVKYFLMHKDVVCGTLIYDESTGRIVKYHDYKTGYSPYLGNSDNIKIKKWWEMRSVPASRTAIQDVLKNAGCFNSGSYLAKNLALSMTDAYWIRPETADVSFDDVKLSNLSMYHNGKIPYHNATSYDPNASLGGQMDKYWDLSYETPVLVKESYRYFGQQSVNEVFATRIHELQNTDVPFVRYTASITEDRGILSKCAAFTSERIEFISAYEVVESQKGRNDVALYDSYINICSEIGIDREEIQRFMDYQTMTDFIISNTDEHLLNFGVLRDSDTMQIIAPAPIFDSGNSMFFLEDRRQPYTRAGILDRPITSFYKKEESMLKKVRDRNVVKIDLLPDAKEVKEIYEKAGIPEWKADVISKNYEIKVQLCREFQKGKLISLYEEKKREKSGLMKQPDSHADQKFIMLCGLPGSGKTEAAEKIVQAYAENGYRRVSSEELYSIDRAVAVCRTGLLIDERILPSDIRKKDGYENTVTVISPNAIRSALIERLDFYDNAFVFAIIDAQMKTALISGTTVVYDASNLDREARAHFVDLAETAGVKARELYVMEADIEDLDTDIPGLKLAVMKMRLEENMPDYSEGWTSIFLCGKELAKEEELDDHDNR